MTVPPLTFPLFALAVLLLTACGGAGPATRADAGTRATAAPAAAVAAPAAPAAPAAAAPAVGTVPPAVIAVGEHGEDLYDAINESNWPKATAIADSLDASIKALPASDVRLQSQLPALVAVVDTLHRAIASKHRYAAIEAANQVTYHAAKMTEPYQPTTPAAVSLLDYYGREVEIWAAQKNMPKLRETTTAMRAAWNSVRAAVESHGGTAAARDMERDVANVEAATTPAAFARTAKPVLDQVDVLEKVFSK